MKKFCLLLAAIIFMCFIAAGTVFILNLSYDIQNASDKLGADIMIVPAGYDPRIDSILLSGKPSASYLPENSLEIIKNLAREKILGIEKISPQIFMATLRASCCAYPVQIMGIDYDSDFIIKSWLDKNFERGLNDDEIILGFHSKGNVGDEIIFFDKPLKIVGKLERTGMGIDSSVFTNRYTIIDLSKAADKIKTQKLAENNNLISVIMLKLKAGEDSQATAKALNRELNSQGMYALFSKKFVSNISSTLVITAHIVKYFSVVLWLTAAIIITALLFSLRAGKKKEILR
ncbi:MAG: ABC transporter permease [Synergistaceae bacterium]|nr:ABC transporter permease [Synergistaceae bacterium]